MNVLIQVNISEESNKNGININDCKELAKIISLMPHLNLRGIMAMPSKQKNNAQYNKTKIIFDQLRKKYPLVDTLSLGTSFDIQESLLASSNMIRIGRHIFNK